MSPPQPSGTVPHWAPTSPHVFGTHVTGVGVGSGTTGSGAGAPQLAATSARQLSFCSSVSDTKGMSPESVMHMHDDVSARTWATATATVPSFAEHCTGSAASKNAAFGATSPGSVGKQVTIPAAPSCAPVKQGQVSGIERHSPLTQTSNVLRLRSLHLPHCSTSANSPSSVA